MMVPCFTAMIDGAIAASNPPAGLTAVSGDGTADATPTMNAIFAALPHSNTNTRNVIFPRPSARYKIFSRINITVSGTMVICPFSNDPVRGNSATDPYITGWTRNAFRGNGLSPAVRMDNVRHVLWHGGGFRGRDAQTGGTQTQTFIEMGTTSFCVASCFFCEYTEILTQISALGAAEFSDLNIVADIWQLNTNGTAWGLHIGRNNIRTDDGQCRCCATTNYQQSLNSTGPTLERALDCLIRTTYSEFHNGTSPNAAEFESGCLRVIWLAGNVEGVTGPEFKAGSTGCAVGHNAWDNQGASTEKYGFGV